MNKPITILREEFINTITETINGSGLPPFVISPILENIMREVKRAELEQLKSDKEKYEKELSEDKKEVKENKI